MRILVIGGNRFFGKRLASLLLERGDQVTLLNRGQSDDGFGDRVERIRMDRKNFATDTPEFERRSWDVVYDQVCYDAVEAEAACEAFADKTAHYVFTSSQSVYGGGREIPEQSFDPHTYRFSSPVDRHQDYSEAKRQAEATFFQKAKFTVTAARFPIVMGPDDYTRRLVFHVERVRDGKPIYIPKLDARMSFVHAADAAHFLFELSTRKAAGPMNACSQAPIALHELILRIEAATERKALVVSQPEQGDASPFGVTEDWYMSTAKLEREGLSAPRPILEWLPTLIAGDLAKLGASAGPHA